MAIKKNGQYDQDQLDKIVLAIDSEIGGSASYGNDDLSSLRREYYARFFRADTGTEEEGFSTYHSPLIQDHVLQTRAYLMRPFNKSKKPIVDFGDELSTGYINHLFRYEMDGKIKLQDSAFNGALLKTMAAKIWVKPVFVVEEDYAVFEGSDKEEIETEIDLFFSDEEGMEQIGEIDWSETPAEGEAPVEEAPVAPVNTFLNPDQQAITDELAPQPEAPIQEVPVEEEVPMDYKAVVRFKKERTERRPQVDIIAPYEFYISSQAPSQEEAAVVGRVSPIKKTDLRTAFPDAPKLNGVKGKKKVELFWEELSSDWINWAQQSEWYDLWVEDNSSYYEGYTFQGAQDADSPAHAFLTTDVDIQMDLEDSGYARWYNVVKCGHFVMSCEPISQPSFKVGSLIPVGGRWLGLSLADLIWDEDKSVTTNMRAADNGVLQSTYANPIVDREQIEIDDVINRAPDTVIRRKLNAIQKTGVPGLEWTKTPGLDGNTFQLVEKYQEFAGTSTGAGKFFQAHERDNVASARVGEDTAKLIENNSDLMLDDISSNFWSFWTDVLLMLHNAAIMGKATPVSFRLNGEEVTIDPVEDLPIIKHADIDLVIGSNEEQNQIDNAMKGLELMQALEATPSIANILTPAGKTAILANVLTAIGADKEDLSIMIQAQGPADALQSPEVQQAIQQATEQAQQQAQAEIEAYKKSVEMEMKMMKTQAEVEKLQAESENLHLHKEELAAKYASEYEMRDQAQQKIDDRKEVDSVQLGLQEEKLDDDRFNSDREYELAKKVDPIRTDLG